MGLKKLLNIEPKSQRLMGVLTLFLALTFVLASLGKIVWLNWLAVGIGIFLGLLIWSEAGVYNYFQRKGYKTITAGDFLVWISGVIGAIVILNSIFLIGALRNASPTWLSNFLASVSVAVGLGVGILAIIYILVPKPKA